MYCLEKDAKIRKFRKLIYFYTFILTCFFQIHCPAVMDPAFDTRDSLDNNKISREEFIQRIEIASLLLEASCPNVSESAKRITIFTFGLQKELPSGCDSFLFSPKEFRELRSCRSRMNWYRRRDVDLCLSEIYFTECSSLERTGLALAAGMFPYCFSMLAPQNRQY